MRRPGNTLFELERSLAPTKPGRDAPPRQQLAKARNVVTTRPVVRAQSFDTGAPIDLRYSREAYAPALALSNADTTWRGLTSPLSDHEAQRQVESFEDEERPTDGFISTSFEQDGPPARRVEEVAREPTWPEEPACTPPPEEVPGASPLLAKPSKASKARARPDEETSAALAAFQRDLDNLLRQQDAEESPPPVTPAQPAPAPASAAPPPPSRAAPAGHHPHDIFDRIGTAMSSYATTFNLPPLAMEQRFDEFDNELEQQVVRSTADKPVSPPRATPLATSLALVDEDELAGDLATLALEHQPSRSEPEAEPTESVSSSQTPHD